ncbi:proline--tRNA ligase [Ehrlichia chaffeensis str. Heartland]|uniref:Proline--tRNA ligase n=2 Tax=Ehrlichia chaffeensis (strain ATCC CRL-10679 / Arkansas) TaxID=205920 RepID=SYP_EHRCR|nr:proline--tRNA ligase [Ehrlichia chaffeensis]Q2GG92.1 RecName: Full=Proline--tRNA ligase; AltName: Full=Prolyl-tRNA synthetase; Short=ProRS [Ehrlichia chaffeensis str. Arkansas]ABD44598.1 prolyl-tRNA synthetase [Ehrlichia chaffeensis str. Arkansas]AHX03805.1 proline--tRNA ligase [Ehrlichia chaffeensis str. Heartland]AHX05469.1 proline--tRNA ligase [Ehrlichia chaffeensis str. Jax]AHX06457.1 proline--tRNA ligase [Ehrlichia chaffeensis str. Liberty]AHX07873.1 proline--tRNA ligase [Ehrlichia ch
MRLSDYYVPTLKETSADISVISHKYSIRAGLIKQIASGIYTWLPLGLKVLKNIENIVREEMNKSGSLEILMPLIQPASLWKESGRYDDYGSEMLRITDRNQREMLFGPTHEEVITDILRTTPVSHKDLPLILYQIQWKFRDELRPRYGIMRCREFLMKDAYSFDKDFSGAISSYNLMFKTYIKIFQKLGLTPIAVKADSGPIGGNLSHEFHVLANSGESTLYYDQDIIELMNSESIDVEKIKNTYTAADDMHDPQACPISSDKVKISKGIEIGHIFHLGDKYSKPMNANFCDSNNNKLLQMGCYGIGVSRLVAAIIEVFHDNKGIIWPETVAPFKFSLVNLYTSNDKCKKVAENLHMQLYDDVLYDDTDDSPGIKLARTDLLGMPWQVIIGKSTVEQDLIEVRNRLTKDKVLISTEQFLNKLKK